MLALCLLTLLAYATSFTAGFVLDSKALLLEDPRIRQATAGNLNLILHRTYWWPYTDSNLYRPVTTLSYLFNYAMLGNETHAAGYHVVNLLLHGGNVLLLYALSLRLSRRASPSFFVAALWAVHPLSTEAVTNLVGRADLLAGLGVLGGLYLYIRSGGPHVASGFSRTNASASGSSRASSVGSGFSRAGDRSTWWLLAAIGTATLGMFSKENAVAVVGVIVLYDVAFRLPQTPLRHLASRWLAFLLPLFLLLYVRSVVVPPLAVPDPFVDNPIVGAGFWTGRLTALAVAGRYLWLMVWPLTLSSDYSYAQIPAATGTPADWAAWTAVALIAIGALVLLARSVMTRAEITRAEGVPLAAFALAFACLAFLPASNLLFTTGTIMAERLMYLPSAGLLACSVVVLCAMARVVKVPALVPIVASVITCALGVRTATRNLDWRDDVSLWASAARAAPGSFKAHQGLADALYESDANHRVLGPVIAESDRSVAILDPLPDALNVTTAYRRAAGYQLEHGDLLRDSGTSTSASDSASAYQRSIAFTLRYLAIVEATKPSDSGSTALQQPVAATSPMTPETRTASIAPLNNNGWVLSEAYVMLATGYSRLGNTEKALDASRLAQTLQPLNSIPYRVMAAALIDARRFDEAAIWLLTGFTVSGDSELRQATIDLYQHGGDPKGCALKAGNDGPVLDPDCETVRHQLCAATVQAIQIQTTSGRRELADRLAETTLKNYGCR